MFKKDELSILYRGLEDREEVVNGQIELGIGSKSENKTELKEIELLKIKILNMGA